MVAWLSMYLAIDATATNKYIFSTLFVPGAGVEPARCKAHGPKPCVSTSSTTPALPLPYILTNISDKYHTC